MFSLLAKIVAVIALLIGAVIVLIHVFPYLLILLAVFGLVKLFQALNERRKPPSPPSGWR